MELTHLQVVRDLMRRHNVTARKSFSQNFIINPSVCPRMADRCGADEHTGVVEIGPGIGVLTQELCRRAQRVVAIEADRHLLPVLEETVGGWDNLTIVHDDILKVDLPALLAREFPGMPVVVCANLPYSITSPILSLLIERQLPIEAATVMVQKEVARRMVATPPARNASPLSVSCAVYTQPQLLFDVRRGSFYPAPAVDSSVVKLALRKTPLVEVADRGLFFTVVRAVFSQRRKTILNTLSAGLKISKDTARAILEEVGVCPNTRPEQLHLEQFADIARAVMRYR